MLKSSMLISKYRNKYFAFLSVQVKLINLNPQQVYKLHDC